MIPRFLVVYSALACLVIPSLPGRVSSAAPPPKPLAPAARERLLREQAQFWKEATRAPFALGKRVASIESAKKALALERVLFGQRSHGQLFLLDWLVQAYQRTNQRTEAGNTVQIAITMQRKFLVETPGSTSRQDWGAQAVEVRIKILGKDHALVGTALVDLALAQEAAGRRDLAEETLLRARVVFKAATARRELEFGTFGHRIDADYHLHRLKLIAAAGNKEVHQEMPSDLIKGLDLARKQADEAEQLETKGDSAAARSKWSTALTTTRSALWKASGSCSIRLQLEAAAQGRRISDRCLSFAARAGLPPCDADSLYRLHFSLLKGSVFIQQWRVWLERRHPALWPFFDANEEVNQQLGESVRLAGKDGTRRRRLLEARKEALEAEAGRRWAAVVPRFQPRPPAQQLPPGTILVDYLVYHYSSPARGRTDPAQERLACFLSYPKVPLGQPAVKYLDLGSLAPLHEAVTSWRRSIQRGGGAVAPAILRKQLWVSLGAEIPKAQVVLISPDGPLCALPFAALPGARAGTYLGEEIDLALAPTPLLLTDRRKSMTEFLAKRDSPLYAVGSPPALIEAPLLVGDVDFHEAAGAAASLEPLPGTAREVEAIGKNFAVIEPGKKATLLMGKRATPAAVRQEAVRHKWLHLATHGYFERSRSAADRQSPDLRSALVLAGGRDGTLTALEVSGLDLTRTAVVVLSACETGLGKTEQGEGVLGLQRAFLTAGSRSVVASLWQVPDEATAVLMDRFYRNLWQGKKPPLAALCEAQRWLIQRGRKHPEIVRGMTRRDKAYDPAPGSPLPPLYWAGFVLAGDWR